MPTRKPKDLALIGHFAVDTIILRELNSVSHSLGGGVTYGSLAAANFDPNGNYSIISKIGKDFSLDMLNIFNTYPIDLSGIKEKGDCSTKFTLDYHDGTRDLKLGGKAEVFCIEDLSESLFNANAIHLTPIADEYSEQFITGLIDHEQTQDSVFGLDVQGMIRGFNPDGTIFMKKDIETQSKIKKLMQKFGDKLFFKGSEYESCAVAGTDDYIEATEILGETGCHVLTTLGPEGLIYKAPGEKIVSFKAYSPEKLVDETGAGDCFMATLMIQIGRKYREQGKKIDINDEIKIASAAASFLVEQKGPSGFQSKEKIMQRATNGIQIESKRIPTISPKLR